MFGNVDDFTAHHAKVSEECRQGVSVVGASGLSESGYRAKDLMEEQLDNVDAMKASIEALVNSVTSSPT